MKHSFFYLLIIFISFLACSSGERKTNENFEGIMEYQVTFPKGASAMGMKEQDMEKIAEMMKTYRDNPPIVINNSKVVQLLDYQLQKGRNLNTNEQWNIDLPKSNVLQFILADGSKISARPSGTEPKIKFYFSVNSNISSKEEYENGMKLLKLKIQNIITDMQLG